MLKFITFCIFGCLVLWYGAEGTYKRAHKFAKESGEHARRVTARIYAEEHANDPPAEPYRSKLPPPVWHPKPKPVPMKERYEQR